MSHKNRVSSLRSFNARLTSTISITLVLVLLGFTILVLFLGKGLSNYVRENMSFSIMLAHDITDAQLAEIRRDVDAHSFVQSSRFISREEALAHLIQDLGEDPTELLGFNPAQDAIEVFLRGEYTNSESIANISQLLTQNTNVTDLLYQREAIDLINENLQRIMTILLALAVALLFISFTLIRNTIRLSVYSKRFTIKTMQLVGATGSFIRRPFVQGMMINGIMAGLCANGIIFLLLTYFGTQYAEIHSIISVVDLIIIFSTVVVLGILISTIAAAFSVNRFLKMDTDDLYYS